MAAARSALWRTKAWIGGKWRTALSENTYPVYSPSSGELLAHVGGVVLTKMVLTKIFCSTDTLWFYLLSFCLNECLIATVVTVYSKFCCRIF